MPVTSKKNFIVMQGCRVSCEAFQKQAGYFLGVTCNGTAVMLYDF